MLIVFYLKIIGIFTSTGRLHEEVNKIALEQNMALFNAFGKQKQGITLDQTILQYQTSLRQVIVDLHLLSYPLVSFYIDHPLSTKIYNHQYTSLLDTMYTLVYISNRFKYIPLISGCGSVHMHNLHDMHSMQGHRQHRYIISIRVPHMFYIHIQFLEIILVGGFMPTECLGFQSFAIRRNTIFPFTPLTYWSENIIWEHIFCGTHHPFTTIYPGNLVKIKGRLQIDSTYASIKLRYSMIDMLVSNNYVYNIDPKNY